MKVLWITNSLLPEANALLGVKTEVKGTGGWVFALANALKWKDIKIYIAAISDLVKTLTKVEGEQITYFAIPRGNGDVRYNKQHEEAYREIYQEVKPDVVHIHGTEYPHSLAALNACGAEHTVVSLQGLVSVIARYNRAGISKWDALKNLTFHDFVRGGIIRQQREMFNAGEYEKEVLYRANNVIGRTSFDRQHTWAINPVARYYHSDEVLREEFYESRRWSYDECTAHSIFMSQAAFPIKGLHIVVQALAIVANHFPDVQLRVAGQDLTRKNEGLKGLLRLTGYGCIVKKLIKRYGLNDRVSFTGRLNAKGMVEEYLNANLFLCPSSIENSPNSLAEAQLLGVPCIASYVGGIPDMMKGDEDHLYRYDDAEMLAYKICELFEKAGNIETEIEHQSALYRHNREKNINELIEIYLELAK